MVMTLETLRELFFWCMVVNFVIYSVTAIATITMRGFICAVHKRIFGMDEAETMRTVQRYLGNYKLLITIFNFAPWLALLIIR